MSRVSVSSSELDVTLLSFGQHITALTSGRVDPELDYDVLALGSQTHVMVYDVENNSELFYKEVCTFLILLRHARVYFLVETSLLKIIDTNNKSFCKMVLTLIELSSLK